jgi:hypothetical protein
MTKDFAWHFERLEIRVNGEFDFAANSNLTNYFSRNSTSI